MTNPLFIDWFDEPTMSSAYQSVAPTTDLTPLIAALNRLPGVTCIAHEFVVLDCGMPDSYSVTFEVAHTEDGWHALAFLAWLMSRWLHNESVQLHLAASTPGANPTCDDVAFVLQGTNGHDPLLLTAMLNQAILESFEILIAQPPRPPRRN